MRKRRSAFGPFATLLIGAVVGGAAGVADVPADESATPLTADNVAARFREDYPAALQRMEAFFNESRAAGEVEIVRTPANGEPDTLVIAYVFQRSGGRSKWESAPRRRDEKPSPPAQVWCRNPDRYAFQLRRDPEEKTFFLAQLRPRDEATVESQDRSGFRFYNASHAVLGVPVSELLASPEFVVKSVELEPTDAGELVHVAYDFRQPPPGVLRSGELWLRPDRGWAIDHCRTDVEVGLAKPLSGSAAVRVDYQGSLDGVAVPARIELRQQLGERISTVETMTFSHFEHAPTAAEEFTLAHYSLPEVEPETPIEAGSDRRLIRWIGFGHAALAVVLIAVIAYRRRQKAQLAGTAPAHSG